MARDNGICPHCGRADAIREVEAFEEKEDDRRRFVCGGCNATWMGVRRRISAWKRAMR